MIVYFGQIQDVVTDVARPFKVFEGARREIADANTVKQVKRIVALASGLAAAARKATDREMEAEAEALRLEAERRLGQLMQAQRETFGFNIGTRGSRIKGARVDEKPTLAEAGIDKNLAHRARRQAAKSEEEFKADIAEKRDNIRERKRKAVNKSVAWRAPSKSKIKVASASKPRIRHVDIIAVWNDAPPEERTKAINSIGLKSLLAALPPDWIPLLEEWLAAQIKAEANR